MWENVFLSSHFTHSLSSFRGQPQKAFHSVRYMCVKCVSMKIVRGFLLLSLYFSKTERLQLSVFLIVFTTIFGEQLGTGMAFNPLGLFMKKLKFPHKFGYKHINLFWSLGGSTSCNL